MDVLYTRVVADVYVWYCVYGHAQTRGYALLRKTNKCLETKQSDRIEPSREVSKYCGDARYHTSKQRKGEILELESHAIAKKRTTSYLKLITCIIIQHIKVVLCSLNSLYYWNLDLNINKIEKISQN